MTSFFDSLSHGPRLKDEVAEIDKQIKPLLETVAETVFFNQWKVLQALQQHYVSDHHFVPSSGYGYGDLGREVLEDVYASVFRSEAAIVRPQIISGTHAIATCLYGVLRPGDELLYITGTPYDTLQTIIGQSASGKPSPGSLSDLGITYREVPLTHNGLVDHEGIRDAIRPETKVIGIQRSCGYDIRPSFNIDQIEEMVKLVREIKNDVIIFVDNCYGEFVEKKEPTEVGVDLMAGSLIKNPGGGLVRSGGYIVGREDLIQLVGTRLFAPGIGLDGGANLNTLPEMYQGLFMAPHVVGEALKGAIFSAAILERLGYKPSPKWDEPRTDIIQTIQFDNREALLTFCQGIQKGSPVNAHVTPAPGPMPGYDDPVVMAAGTFIQGSSIELSADGPLRPPYVGFVQGGLTFEHVKIGILTAINELLEQRLL